VELTVARVVGRVGSGQVVEKAAGLMRHNLGSRGLWGSYSNSAPQAGHLTLTILNHTILCVTRV